MDFIELFHESTLTLTVNKVRTALAMLGVVIGIGSVIALMSLGQASQQSITNQIESLGTNLLTIRPGAASAGGIRGSFGGGTTLTNEDAQALEVLPSVQAVAPVVSQNSQLVVGRNNTNSSVISTTDEYLTVNNLALAQGSFITDRHVTGMSRVVVLGSTVAEELFDTGVNPVGQRIRIDGQSFTVLGVMASKGGSGFSNPDASIYVPITTAQKQLFGQDYLSSIVVSATGPDQMEQAEAVITSTLLRNHRITDSAAADFSILSQEDLLGTASAVTSTFTTLLSGIAAISLVVGGIGIMNIMLVTVTERTREIGLRKALGAKKENVVTQFLLEATLITVLGGLMGVLLGLAVSYILSSVMSLPFTVAVSSIGLAFLVSGIIGVVFGWYPAQKAASLQPIDALRYE